MKIRFAALVSVLLAWMSSPLFAVCTFNLLSPYPPFAVNSNAGDIATGDFNNDGKVDLAIVNRQSDKVSILLGTGGGTFGPPTQVASGDWSQGDIQAADFNNDGNIDLLLAIPYSNDFTTKPHLKILLGDGTGNFTPVAYYEAQQRLLRNPMYMALGDFNGDGYMDAVTTGDDGFSAMVNVEYQHNGTRMAQKASYTTESPGLAMGIATADFDGDGLLDVAVSNIITKKVYLFYGVADPQHPGRGDGTFSPSANTIDASDPNAQPEALAAADLNGDGKADLVIAMRNPANDANVPPLKVALSNGSSRSFGQVVNYGALLGASKVLVRDIDGDGKVDAMVTDLTALQFFHGNGDGTFAQQQGFGTGALGLAADDFDSDGGLDAVTTQFAAGKATVYMNSCGRVGLNLTATPNPAPEGTAITVTGTLVSPPALAATGTLTLKRGTTILNSASLNAGTQLTATMNGLVHGTYMLTAEYSGDSHFLPFTTSIQQVVTVPPFGPPPGLNAISFGGPVQLSWFATAATDHYEVWRSNGAGWSFVGNAASSSYSDSTAPATALLYKVRAIAANTTASEFSAADLALRHAFTDGTLVAGTTPVKLVHLMELREDANAVRALAGLGAATWTEPSPVVIKAAHVTELRNAINQARSTIGLAPFTFTDSSLAVGSTPIKAVHFEELRQAMR
jgi:hypothetical protein